MDKGTIKVILLFSLVMVVIITTSMLTIRDEKNKEEFITWCTKEYNNMYKDVVSYCKYKESRKVD